MTRDYTMPQDHKPRPFSDWSTEALKEYEERLYDREIEGEDTWFERDQVLWELASRTAL